MKKIISAISLAVVLSASVTAFADTVVTYDSTYNQVTSGMSQGKSTVLITKGTGAAEVKDIVYIDQAKGSFDATAKFLLKADPEPGEYTIKFGGDTAEAKSFYIGVGLQQTDSDLLMTSAGGTQKVTDGWAIGYTVTAPTGSYESLIIEKNGGIVLGCPFELTLSGEGMVKYGVQIEADTEEELGEISKVYISTRTVSGNTATEVQK